MNQQFMTQDEAQRLLDMIKNTLIETISFPEKGTTVSFEVEGETKKDLFKINIYRGKINRQKYNINALVKKNDVSLLELHVNPGSRHINPDGTVLECSHWHIYSEKYGRAEAFPAEDIESENFVENTIMFLDKFNVIKKPIIQFQLELV